jgi:hypothetical protein
MRVSIVLLEQEQVKSRRVLLSRAEMELEAIEHEKCCKSQAAALHSSAGRSKLHTRPSPSHEAMFPMFVFHVPNPVSMIPSQQAILPPASTANISNFKVVR